MLDRAGLALKIPLTIVCDARDDPPTLAMIGAVRWMRRKVVINGADPWIIFVRYGSAALARGKEESGFADIIVKLFESGWSQ